MLKWHINMYIIQQYATESLKIMIIIQIIIKSEMCFLFIILLLLTEVYCYPYFLKLIPNSDKGITIYEIQL